METLGHDSAEAETEHFANVLADALDELYLAFTKSKGK